MVTWKEHLKSWRMINMIKRNEAKILVPIISAYAEGRILQYKEKEVWRDIEDSEGLSIKTIIEEAENYRIKPKYRPFANAEECWKEMLQHNPLGWFKDKKAKEFFTLNCISDKDPKIKTYEYLFNDCVFMDGSICGVKLEV